MAVNSAVFCTLLFLVYCYNGQMSAVIWGSIDHATPWEVAPVHDYARGRGYGTKMSAYKTDDEVSYIRFCGVQVLTETHPSNFKNIRGGIFLKLPERVRTPQIPTTRRRAPGLSRRDKFD
eukprot:SAG31_NODE_1478_length_8183_cov_5.227992_8_plen_120_part_00